MDCKQFGYPSIYGDVSMVSIVDVYDKFLVYHIYIYPGYLIYRYYNRQRIYPYTDNCYNNNYSFMGGLRGIWTIQYMQYWKAG